MIISGSGVPPPPPMDAIPPPPPIGKLEPKAVAADPNAQLFEDINKGLEITHKLKKVRKVYDFSKIALSPRDKRRKLYMTLAVLFIPLSYH